MHKQNGVKLSPDKHILLAGRKHHTHTRAHTHATTPMHKRARTHNRAACQTASTRGAHLVNTVLDVPPSQPQPQRLHLKGRGGWDGSRRQCAGRSVSAVG